MGMIQNSVYIAVWSKGAEAPVTFEYNLDNEISMILSDKISFLPKLSSVAQLIEKMNKSFEEETWDDDDEPVFLKDICDAFEESCGCSNPFRRFTREIKKLKKTDIYKVLLLTDNAGDGCREYRWKWVDFDEKTEKMSSATTEVSEPHREDKLRHEQLNRIISEEFGKMGTTPRYNVKNAIQLQNGSFQPICPNCKHKSQNQIMLFGDCAESTLFCRNCGNQYDVNISLCEDRSTSCVQDNQKTSERAEKKAPINCQRSKSGKTKRIDFGSGVQFELPVGFDFSNEKDDDGEEQSVITYGEYKNEIGESDFKFKCSVELITDSKKKIEVFRRRKEDLLRYGQLNGKHTVTLCGMGVPLSFFGRSINMQDVTAYIDITDDLSICITAVDQIKEEKDTYLYEGMSQVLAAIRIHGEELMLDDLSASVIEDITGIFISGNSHKESQKNAVNTSRIARRPDCEYAFPTHDVIDARQKILIRNRKNGRKQGQYDLCMATPQDELERNAIAVKQFWYACEEYSKGYIHHLTELQNIAGKISGLFVNDPLIPHRDLELYSGNIHDIFSFHALRSFVWTSNSWCKKKKKPLSDFSIEDALALSQFIAERNGVNYNRIDNKDAEVGRGLLGSMHEAYIIVNNPKGFIDIPRDKYQNTGPGDADIFKVVEDLWTYRNIMADAADYLKDKTVGALSEAENVLREITAAWCAYVFACRNPFFYIYPAKEKVAVVNEIPTWSAPKIGTKHLGIDGAFEAIDNTLVACYQSSGTIVIPKEIIDDMTPPDTKFDGIGHGEQIERVIYPPNYYGRIRIGAGVKSVECHGTALRVSTIHSPAREHRLNYLSIDKATPETKIYLYNAKHLREIVLPEGMEKVDLWELPYEIERVVFPESMREINSSSFWSRNLKRVEVPRTCPALGMIQQFLAKEKKEEILLITPSRREQESEAVRNSLMQASSATDVLKIYEEHRDIIQADFIRKMLLTRAQKTASRLQNEINSSKEYREQDLDRVKQRFLSVLNLEYNAESWQKCCEMGCSIMDNSVLRPIREKLTQPDDPTTTFREIPICLARYVLEKNMENHQKSELDGRISKITVYLSCPVALGDNPPPPYDRFKRMLQMQISEFHIDNDFCENLQRYYSDGVISYFMQSMLQLDCPKDAEEIESRIVEIKMKQYDEASLKYDYVMKSHQVSEILNEPVLPAHGELPDRNTYCSYIMQRLTRIEIDSRYVEGLQKYLADATVFSFGGKVFAGTENNPGECINAIIERKMERYDRVAAAANTLNEGKAELAQEKAALEQELSHLGLFAWGRKKEIRMLLKEFPAKEADFIAKGEQTIAAADYF